MYTHQHCAMNVQQTVRPYAYIFICTKCIGSAALPHCLSIVGALGNATACVMLRRALFLWRHQAQHTLPCNIRSSPKEGPYEPWSLKIPDFSFFILSIRSYIRSLLSASYRCLHVARRNNHRQNEFMDLGLRCRIWLDGDQRQKYVFFTTTYLPRVTS